MLFASPTVKAHSRRFQCTCTCSRVCRWPQPGRPWVKLGDTQRSAGNFDSFSRSSGGNRTRASNLLYPVLWRRISGINEWHQRRFARSQVKVRPGFFHGPEAIVRFSLLGFVVSVCTWNSLQLLSLQLRRRNRSDLWSSMHSQTTMEIIYRLPMPGGE